MGQDGGAPPEEQQFMGFSCPCLNGTEGVRDLKPARATAVKGDNSRYSIVWTMVAAGRRKWVWRQELSQLSSPLPVHHPSAYASYFPSEKQNQDETGQGDIERPAQSMQSRGLIWRGEGIPRTRAERWGAHPCGVCGP